MGIFDDYGVNPDDIKESNFDVPDGTYRFEISEAETLDGTNNKPDTSFFIIDYQLEDEDGDAAGSTREWFTMAEDNDSETKRARQSQGFLKSRLKSLKVADLKSFDGSEIVGLTGTLRLASTPGKGANKGKTFQNVKSVVLDETEEAEAPVVKKAAAKRAPAKAKVEESDEEIKARVKAKQAARAAASEESSDDDDDNPFGAK